MCLYRNSYVYKTIRVITRDNEEILKRYRKCPSCRALWATYESCDEPDPETAFRVAEIKTLLDQVSKILS